MSDVILYNYFRSSTSYRARIALHYKRIPFEYRPIHLLNNGGEQLTTEFKALNPSGEVPCLVHGKTVISQSFAIIEYLEEVFPEPNLFPKNPALKAKIRQACEIINSGIHPLHNLKVLKILGQWAQWDQEKKDQWCRHWIETGFEALIALIKPTATRFSFGEQVTVADIFIVPQIVTALRFGVQMEKYPLLERIKKECDQLDSFKAAHPVSQIDTPEDMKKS